METPVRLGLLSRSLGPTCSNVEYFYLRNERHLYRAYAVPGGAILVQKLPVTQSELTTESVVTEVVIDGLQSTSTNRIDDITILSFCKSPNSILVGASTHDLSFYALLLSTGSRSELDSPRKKEPTFRRLLSVPFPGVVAMSWTGDGGGLLLADRKGQISCLVISVESSTSISQRQELICNMEVHWVHKMSEIQSTLSAGHSITSPLAIASKSAPNKIKIVQSEGSIQELEHFAPVLNFSWSPGDSEGTLTPGVCLMTVCTDQVIRIWTQSPNQLIPSLGGVQLHTESESSSQEFKFSLGGIIELEKEAEIVSESIQATWLVPCLDKGGQDHRLHWIGSTYTILDDGIQRQNCAIYAIHGMPLKISDTQIGSSRILTHLHNTTQLRDHPNPVKSLEAYLVEMDPIPKILLTETSFQESLNSAESHTSMISVKQEKQQGLILTLESNSKSEIVGFTSAVTQLIAHPKYDLVCVITEQRVLSIWDLWPVRKLLKVEGEDLEIGPSILTVIWIDAEIRLKYGELGYLLLVGQSALVLCLVTTDLIKGLRKPAVNLEKTALLKFCNPVPVDCITLLRRSQSQATSQDLGYLARGQDPNTGEAAYHLIEVQFLEEGDCNLQISEIKGNKDSKMLTVFDSIQEGVIVTGTSEGTLEFYSISDSNHFQFCNSCVLSPSISDHSSFVSCISVCPIASYIACVTSFDLHQNEDKIHILQSESTNGSLDFRLEDSFVSAGGIVAQICWVPSASPVLRLVVGYQAGQVDVFVRRRQGLWIVVGSYLSSLELTGLTTTHLGLPIVGAGRHMLFLSSDSGAFTSHLTDDFTTMQNALHSGGPLAEYHPISLLVLLHVGHLASIGAIFQKVVEFLKDWEGTPQTERVEEVYPPTINGPSADLEQSLVEPLAPDFSLVKLGPVIIQSVPFEGTGSKELKTAGSSVVESSLKESRQETALLTGQFDMSAFGMVMDDSGFTSEEETIEDAPEGNGHLEELDVIKEDCLYFDLEPDFKQRTKQLLFFNNSNHLEFDKDYLKTAILAFNSRDEKQDDSVLPLDCLLQLSSSSINTLGRLLDLYMNWMEDRTSDVASKKFLRAVKLIPCSISCQPKQAKAKTDAFEVRRESFVSPFLKLENTVHRASAASVASTLNASSKIDERLTASYISWPEKVGITQGIESIHILWATESQDPQSLLTQCLIEDVGLSWERMKAVGAGFWLKEKSDVLRAAEEVAKDQFQKKKDPHYCALMYIALKKQTLLSRLFRSNGHPKVADLLIKDFTQEHHQQSAAKNAYVLLGQHRYSLAAAFFLVGGHKQDAIGVCLKEMQDPQLALFLATLIDDEDKNLRRDLILKELYPQALEADDRVAQGMLLWLIGQHFEALDAISTVKALKSELSIADRAISKILLFQFVIFFGFPKLAKRFVPLWLLHQIRNLIAHCAHVLETCGLPSLSLRALQTCQFLHQSLPDSTPQTTFLESWMTRLVTSMMIRHLPSLHAVNARDPAMILWRQQIQQDVDHLNQNDTFSLNFESILHQMEYIMDCLYEVPFAPVFPQETSHPPKLEGLHSKTVIPAISSKRLLMNQPKKEAKEESCEEDLDSKKTGNCFLDPGCYELLHVDGDRCLGVCLSKTGGFSGSQQALMKQVAVATGKYGLHFLEWDPEGSKQTNGVFSRLHSSAHWPDLDWIKHQTVLDIHGDALTMKEVHAGGPLKSHPCLNLFLSGSNEDCLLLWDFDVGSPHARYLLPIKGPGFDSIHHLAWNSSGDRFAGIGQGGTCASWRLESAHRSSAQGSADWSRQVCPRRGHDVEFVEWSGSVLATTGEDEFSKGVISLWDTLAPINSSRIAHLQFRNPVSELTTIPGTLIFLSALESGSIQAHDFRMMSKTEPKTLWSLNSIHDGPITSLEVGWAPALDDPSNWELVVASGGKDGDICIANEVQDKGHLRQRLAKAHWRKSGQLAHLFMSSIKGNLGRVSIPEFGVRRDQIEPSTGTTVLDLDWCDEGLLSAGADGFVQLYPWYV